MEALRARLRVRPIDAGGWHEHPVLVVAAVAATYLPFTLLGYGTDIDVAGVLRAGRSWIEGDGYAPSRGPGAAVHELATGLLDRAGGSVLVNLASVAMATLALWSLFGLVQRDGGRWPAWATLVLATNPWFWIAATSLADGVWALALVLAGAVAAQRDRRLAAGVLFGLAVGVRASSVLLVIGWLVAERTGTRSWRVSWRRVIVTGLTALLVAVVCFVPPWLSADRSFDFVENELEFVGAGVHLGRWAVKNLAVLGVPAAAVLLLGIRRVLGALARWQASVIVRFAVLEIVLSELLFYRFPFKPLHLLPVVAGLALLVGASRLMSRRWMVGLVAAQLIGGLVGLTVAAPDVADRATAGRVDINIVAGPLLTDVRCRLDDREAGPWPPPGSEAATQRAANNARCQNKTWRAEN